MAYIDVLAPTCRPKHPTKVHVWAGISRRGSAGIYMYIFEGIMKKELYAGAMLVLFIKDVFPATHKFLQDNDPKHVSNYAKHWTTENSISWWKTPPESPDLNPIENL